VTAQGTFILADISGYTPFLTEVGIQHAKEITSHLFNGMLKENRRRWKVANVMGDCLFLYSEGGEPPQELAGQLRALYERFRASVTDIAGRSSCSCGACSRSGDLGLKFVAHAGEYDVQDIGGRRELIGPDIIVAHRLLKNSVPLPEYALLTPALAEAAAASGLPAHEGRDEYDDVGAIDYVYLDLGPARREVEQARQVFVSEEEARLSVTAEIDASAEVVWGAFLDFEKRRKWQTTVVEMELVGGKRGEIGEVHRCVHDDGVKMIHLTVAVDPEGRRLTEKIWLLPRLLKDIYITLEARPLPGGGTRAGLHAAMKPVIPLISHAAIPLMVRFMRKDVEKDMRGLKEFCEGEAASGAATREGAERA
jgi:hypothetical protein